MSVRTRFAPSPTGLLHIGGIRTALFSWLYARQNNGKFILRIEDTDQERSTDESTKIILDGMEWLGLDYDEGPYYQSKRFERYKEVIRQLLETGNAYYCYCSKDEVEVMRNEAIKRGEKPRYNGFCRNKTQPTLSNVEPVVRFKNPLNGQVVVNDLVQGRVVFQNEELDDLVIARADGSPTYNLTVVVDDLDMGITDIIRGDDHLNNTPRQINILSALGISQPNYVHIPMILGVNGKKLSKRDGSSSILNYRDEGYLPSALLNYLVRLGWSKNDQEIFSIKEMISEFNLKNINKSASSMDPKKLLWLNQYYLKNTDNRIISETLKAIFDNMNLPINSGPNLDDLIDVQKKRMDTVKDIAEKSVFFYKDFDQYDIKQAEKYLQPVILEPLRTLYNEFKNTNSWDNNSISDIINDSINKYKINMSKISQPLRVAVTGSNISPSIDDTLRLLGQKKCLDRLNIAINFIENNMTS